MTLTFPAWMDVDQEFAKRCWDRFRRWLIDKGASGVMALEFTAAGVPHFHVVLDTAFRSSELERAWASILDVSQEAIRGHGVRSSYVHSPRRLAEYMAKPLQKTAPPGWNVARWWASFGPQQPARPKLAVHGRRSEIDTLLWNLWGQRSSGKPPRTASGALPARFRVVGGVDANWVWLQALGLVE